MKKTTKLLIGLFLLVGLTALSAVLGVTTHDVAAAAAESTTSSLAATGGSSGTVGEYAEGVIDIVLGDTTTVSGAGATVDGSTVKITAAGVYSLSGTLSGGRIEVDAKGKVYLEFHGIDVTSGSGPALLIKDAKKVTITLVDGTTNYLADGAGDDEYDAALFTNDTLVINGSGSLVVTGNDNEGISSDDDLIINSGTITVTAVDDGLNAHDDITITDGDVYILAGGDALDSNGTINLIGGTLFARGSAAVGDGGLDAVGALTITGGTVVASGNSIAAPSSDSTQVSLFVNTGATQAAGTAISVTRDGEEILTFTLDSQMQSFLVSSSRLIAGATYDVYVDTVAGVFTVTAALTPEGAGLAATSAAASTGGR